MVKLFAGGFPRDLEELELKEIFEQFGKVESVNIVRDKHTGISRRFGFVDMAEDEDAKQAIINLHEASIDEETISVKYADDRQKEKQTKRPAARKIEFKSKPKTYQKLSRPGEVTYQKVSRPGEGTPFKRPRKRIR
ncbi:RNA recognition motif-containing protein [Arcticibacter tournemirensis]|uniref:RRM domain-containing protein n=1 Tax=Arcticibacter tournemirensis TaxID=699437 RepID=A0A4Q0M762_9SPHI|nr:hypothetical protein [Arcticibacter tournemirensis]KAA8484124.1 hypothetical protein F1649_07230 [Arcticibacter tournemirensis]RXF68907.1 hypothetical protein EKH83_14390 [Arcticibacter tournemirensis]TQM51867.1 RNA recognition motif-containing protein [Arcticibacter tournemirensis]